MQIGKSTPAEKPVPTCFSPQKKMIIFSSSEQRVERRDRVRNNTEQEKGDYWRTANEEWRKKWELEREERGEYGIGICHYPSWYCGIFATPPVSLLVHCDLNLRNQHNLKEQSLLLTVLLPPLFALVFVLIKLGRTIPRSEQRTSSVSQCGTSLFQRITGWPLLHSPVDTSTSYTPCTMAQSPLLHPLRHALLFALNHLY